MELTSSDLKPVSGKQVPGLPPVFCLEGARWACAAAKGSQLGTWVACAGSEQTELPVCRSWGNLE